MSKDVFVSSSAGAICIIHESITEIDRKDTLNTMTFLQAGVSVQLIVSDFFERIKRNNPKLANPVYQKV